MHFCKALYNFVVINQKCPERKRMNYSSENHGASNAAYARVCMPAGSHLGAGAKAVLANDSCIDSPLYQVLASLGLAVEEVMQITLINYCLRNLQIYRRVCVAIGWIGSVVLRVEETAFYNVGDISPLLFCGTPQESEEA